MPEILYQASSIYWILGKKRKDKDLRRAARELNNQAREISRKYHDLRNAIDSLVGDAEYDFDEGNFDKIPGYAKELETNYPDKTLSYPLWFGRISGF